MAEAQDNSVRKWSAYLEQPSFSSTCASDFENMGGLSVIERDQEDNQRTLANDITLDGPTNLHSTWFRNSAQDTLSDLFGPDSASVTKIDWGNSNGLPSLEEAAEALRNMPLDGDLVGAFAGLSTASKNKSPISGKDQQVYCSHQSLSWFNVSLGGEACQTIFMKNISNIDTIAVTIKIDCQDNNFFKLVSANRLSDEIQVTIKPQEKAEISVVFRPVLKGQISSRIVVRYANRRFPLYLYGYGGKSSVCFREVDFSSEFNHLMVLLPIKTLAASFVLYNCGEENGIFTIQNGTSDHCRISPSNGIVSPLTETTISIRCQIDLTTLKPEGHSCVILHKLTVSVEDQASHLRVEKMKYFGEDPRLNHPKYERVLKLIDDPKHIVLPERKTVFILVCIKAEDLRSRLQKK